MDFEKFQKWAERQYSMRQRIAALFLEGILFVIIIPLFLVAASSYLDRWLQVSRFSYGVVNLFVGLLIAVPGLLFALWSIHAQITLGKGTPVPVMATQNLVAQKPYVYCRNPMTLGTILFYAGIAIWIGSLSAIGVTLLFTAFLVVYIKMIEEKELEARFKSEYADYKMETPFLIPRLKSASAEKGR